MGKSSLNNRERNGYWCVAVILAAIVFSAMLIALWATAPKKTNNRDATVDATTMTAPMQAVVSDKAPATTDEVKVDKFGVSRHIQELAGYYYTQHNFPDQLWLNGAEEIDEHISKVFAFSERLKGLIQKYAGTTETTGAIAKEFSDFNVSEYINGAPKMLFKSTQMDAEKVRAEMERRSKLLELCMMTQDDPSTPSPLYYNKDWKAMMAPAIKMPDAWLAALSFHELGHALTDRRGEKSASSPEQSEEFVREEVKMHMTEQAVLDRAVSGRLTNLFDRILTRAGNADPKLVWLATTTTDLDQFDEILKTRSAGYTMSSIYMAQFLTALSFYAIDQMAVDKDQKMKAKIEAYRLLRSLASP